MIVRVNAQEVDFSLENENNLGDVIKGFEKWLTDSGLLITDIQLNNSHVNFRDQSTWEDIAIEDVDMLDLTALTSDEVRVNNLFTVQKYFELFCEAVLVENEESIRQFLIEYPYIKSSLGLLINGGADEQGSSYETYLDNLFRDAGLLSGFQVYPDKKDSFITALKQIQIVLVDRIKEFTEPLNEISSLVVLLQKIVPEIGDVSVYLQTGKDKEAMSLIIRCSELFQKLIRLNRNLVKFGVIEEAQDENVTEYFQRLNGILSELLEAFGGNDSVLIGDLMEYEIIPLIDELPAIVDHITKTAGEV